MISAVAMLVVRSTAGDVARVDGAGSEGYLIFDRDDGHRFNGLDSIAWRS